MVSALARAAARLGTLGHRRPTDQFVALAGFERLGVQHQIAAHGDFIVLANPAHAHQQHAQRMHATLVHQRPRHDPVVDEVAGDEPVVRPDVGPAVGDVLWMDERDVLDRLFETQKDGTGQAVQVTACDESHDGEEYSGPGAALR